MKKSVFLLIAVVTAFLLSGCRFVRIEEEDRKPVSYTVVEHSDIPEELSRIMEEKKEKEFQLSYETGEDLYLVKGYGRQMSGGYSIQVEELGESGNGLFFITRLLGPKDLSEVGVPSYPSIVTIATFIAVRTSLISGTCSRNSSGMGFLVPEKGD